MRSVKQSEKQSELQTENHSVPMRMETLSGTLTAHWMLEIPLELLKGLMKSVTARGTLMGLTTWEGRWAKYLGQTRLVIPKGTLLDWMLDLM